MKPPCCTAYRLFSDFSNSGTPAHSSNKVSLGSIYSFRCCNSDNSPYETLSLSISFLRYSSLCLIFSVLFIYVDIIDYIIATTRPINTNGIDRAPPTANRKTIKAVFSVSLCLCSIILGVVKVNGLCMKI